MPAPEAELCRHRVVVFAQATGPKIVAGLVLAMVIPFGARVMAWWTDVHLSLWWYAAMIAPAILTSIFCWRNSKAMKERSEEQIKILKERSEEQIKILKGRLESFPTVAHLAHIGLTGEHSHVLVRCVIGFRTGSSDVPSSLILMTVKSASELCTMKKSEGPNSSSGGWFEQVY